MITLLLISRGSRFDFLGLDSFDMPHVDTFAKRCQYRKLLKVCTTYAKLLACH